MNENTTTTETTNVAENSGGDSTQAVNSQSEKAVSTSGTAQTEKTFTQKELDEIVKQRLERQAKGQPTKEELKAFHDWQNSQKTAEQLTAEKISAAENAQSAAEKRAELAEAKCIAYSLGVDTEAVDDVIALALSKVNENTDISTAIKGVVEKYPAFGRADTEPKGITTGVAFGNGGNAVSGVEAAFLAKNPGLKI